MHIFCFSWQWHSWNSIKSIKYNSPRTVCLKLKVLIMLWRSTRVAMNVRRVCTLTDVITNNQIFSHSYKYVWSELCRCGSKTLQSICILHKPLICKELSDLVFLTWRCVFFQTHEKRWESRHAEQNVTRPEYFHFDQLSSEYKNQTKPKNVIPRKCTSRLENKK